MRKLSCIILIILPFFVTGQTKKTARTSQKKAQVRVNDKTSSPGFVRYNSDNAPSFASFKAVAKEMFGMRAEDGLREYSTEKDDIGFTHHRYQQVYRNYPVEWAIYIVHEKNGMIMSMNGEYYPGVIVSNSIDLSEKTALTKATGHIGAKVYKWELPAEEAAMKKILGKPDFTFKPKGEIVVIPMDGKDKQFKYAFKFDVYAHEPEGRWEIYIDAQTGQVLKQLSLINFSDKSGTAHTKYSGTVEIKTDSLAADTFRLRESGRGNGVETYNLEGSQNISSSVDFLDKDNYWDNYNMYNDEVATDVHWGAENTYDFYKTLLGRNSFDNSGGKLISYVHYSKNYVNANWNGYYMRYGDGDASMGYAPLTGLDICGHELTHGVTGNSAKLVYAGESGALNESFSDIFGNSIEHFIKPLDFKWLVGEDINKGVGLRNMANPNAFKDPDTYGGTFWTETVGCVPSSGNDQCGVHKNSGVQNFWYYLLVQGGSGTNDKDSAFSVSGIGFDKAMRIAYRGLTSYLTPKSTYFDASMYSTQAAIDLYGDNSNEMQQTVNAWYAVGIGQRYSQAPTAGFSVKQSFCTLDTTFRFLNQSGNSFSYLWDFGDGTTSTEVQPLHKYPATGRYTVSLIATNSYGTDTIVRKDYISIYTAQLSKTDSTCPALTSLTTVNTGILNFKLNTIDNSSREGQKEGGYVDFTCQRTNVEAGKKYALSLTPAGTNSVFIRVWIDLNNDGNFSYPGELAYKADSIVGVHNDSITIPPSILTGMPVRVRVTSGRASSLNTPNNPCSSVKQGQVEEYSLVALSVTGIVHNASEAQFSIYPNPTSGRFTIDVSSAISKQAKIVILNALGQEVFRSESELSSKYQLDLSTQKRGVYFIRLDTGSHSLIKKIVLL